MQQETHVTVSKKCTHLQVILSLDRPTGFAYIAVFFLRVRPV